ncbi:MAG TPA: hypothetical protein VFY06_09705, partial [Verrucomicrobiae bacterium]|nr:hypothetical protein [Verrucomicrobiae bacterium]
GAGGRTTNAFTATTIADTKSNNQPFIYPNTVTQFFGPANQILTNTLLTATELAGETLYWFPFFATTNDTANISGASYNLSNSVLHTLTYNVTNAQGGIQLFLVPVTNFVGTVHVILYVSSDSNWYTYYRFGLNPPPYDAQAYAFTFGGTPISALGTNFVADALTPFTNQLVARFTNGVPDSAATNFTAFINWGDNSTNSGLVVADSNWKEVLGSHTYTHAGDYPVYITIRSSLGVTATVVSTASVPPTLSFTRTGSTDRLRWPAWATEYELQTNANLTDTGWDTLSNYPALDGYDSVATNNAAERHLFFRLKK